MHISAHIVQYVQDIQEGIGRFFVPSGKPKDTLKGTYGHTKGGD